MKISPKTNPKKVITVHEQVGRALLKQGRFVLAETKVVTPEPKSPESEVEISPRTGLPKRTYRRRDMEAE